MRDVRPPAAPGEGGVRHRVEVDAPLVGLLGVGPAAVPRVELDGAHLHRPDDVGEPGHAQLVGVQAVAGEVQPHRLDPRRRPARQPLLVHLVAGDAVGEAVQHARPLAQRVDDAVADREVVVDEVELGLAPGGEVDPLGARDPHVEAVDVEHDRLPELTLARGHARHRMPCGAPARGVPRADAADEFARLAGASTAGRRRTGSTGVKTFDKARQRLDKPVTV